MQTTFAHLPSAQTAKLAQFIQKVIYVLYPEKIICYGFRTTIKRDWSPFLVSADFKEMTLLTVDLVIITRNDEVKSDHEIIQIIQKQAEQWNITATCVIQKLAAINESIANGSRFTSAIYRKGVLLYDGRNMPLTPPLQEPDTIVLRTILINRWERCYNQAQQFFKTACYCFENGWNEQATFDLHQCVQHTCMALLRVFTGYRSTTHNLGRLLELIDNFSQEPGAIFPSATKEEKALFALLNKAYSDARYNEQYKVPMDKLMVLMERAKQLLETAQQLYQQKMQSLEQAEPVSFPLTISLEQAASLNKVTNSNL